MKPTIIDQDTGRELWRVADCAEYCGIGNGTWRTYVSDGRAPAHIADLGDRMPLWDALEVQDWHAKRPGSPIKK